MEHQIYVVTRVKIVAPYTLKLWFDDMTVQTIDFEPVLRGELYAPLQDLAVFNDVALDPEAGTIVWPNGADFDPETLHNWPNYRDAWIDRARQLTISSAS